MTMAATLEKYLKQYVDLYDHCVAVKGKLDPQASGEVSCAVKSALETFKIAVDQLAARGAGCEAHSYFVILLKEAGVHNQAEALENQAIVKATGKIKKYAASIAGCLAGGAVTTFRGFTSGKGGFIGGQLRASILFPAGCAAGSKLATEIYVLDKGWRKLKKIGALYDTFNEKVTKVYQALEAHHAYCEALPNIPRNPKGRPKMTPITWEAKEVLISRPAIAPSPKPVPQPAPQPARTIQLLPPPAHPIGEVAEAIMNYAGDLTGVNPAIQEVKELKNLIETLFNDPLKGPEEIINVLLKGPIKQYNAIVNAPKKFADLRDNLFTDPSLEAAWGVATGVLAIVQAIEPLLNYQDEILRNPLKAPYRIAKSMALIPVQNIKGVMELGIQLVRDPLGTGKALCKMILQSPKHVGKSIERSIKRVFGKKSKKRKTVQPSQAEINRFAQQIGSALQACYLMAQERLFILPDKTPDAYLQNMVSDWKAAQSSKTFQGDIVQFFGSIKGHLAAERYEEVRRLSPSAHTEEAIAPLQVVIAFRKLAVETFALHIDRKNLVQAREANQKASQALASSVNTLKGNIDQLDALIDTPEKRAALNAKFSLSEADCKKLLQLQ